MRSIGGWPRSMPPDTTWRLTALLNTGFRAPNVDDLAKVFDSAPGRVVVPNPALRPERTLNAEIGVNKVLDGRHSIQLTAFHTWFTDALVVQPFQQNGRDSLLYDEVMSRVTALTNAGKAFITGASATMTVTLRDRLSWSNAITYTYGRVLNGDDQAPLDHIPPLYGRSGLEWLLARAKVEAYVLYNGWKRVRDYSDSGEDKPPIRHPSRYARLDHLQRARFMDLVDVARGATGSREHRGPQLPHFRIGCQCPRTEPAGFGPRHILMRKEQPLDHHSEAIQYHSLHG
jgi:outer membrane receptor for ferrienterochelin and colicin